MIDKNELKAGESGLIQIHLPEPYVLRHGDRFVIRSSSNDITLGGGEVIDVAPLHHRRKPENLIKKMTAIAQGKLTELISAEVKKAFRAITTEEIAFSLNISRAEVEESAGKKLAKDVVKYEVKDKIFLISKDRLENIRRGIFHAVKEFRKQNPLISRGATLSEIRGSLRIDRGGAGEEVLKEVLQEQTRKGKLKEKDKTWTLGDETGAIDEKLKAHLSFFGGYLKSFEMKTPLLSDLKIQAEKRKLTERKLKQILYNLTSRGVIYRIKDDYLHGDIVNSSREKLVNELSRREGGITVAEFRDLVGGNRKICLLLLTQYDAELVTKRDGDLRFLVKEK
ncbi:SelB C-terminal domain-containing protein [Acidobacteriota bacterium]